MFKQIAQIPEGLNTAIEESPEPWMNYFMEEKRGKRKQEDISSYTQQNTHTKLSESNG